MIDNQGIGKDLLDILNAGKIALSDIEDAITGSIVNTFQAIVDVWEIDCQGKWVVYMKTGIEAAGAALYLIITPTFNEVLENYLQPKPGRLGGRRGRPNDRNRTPAHTGRRLVTFTPGIPDIDHEIASWLPGTDMIQGRKFGPGEYIFWTALDVADRAVWNWLVIEAYETFWTQWISGLMESGKCKFPSEGMCSFETPEQTPFFNNDMWFAYTDLLFLHQENVKVGNSGTIDLTPLARNCEAMLLITGHWRLRVGDVPVGTTAEVGFRITCHNHDGVSVFDETYTTNIACAPNSETLQEVSCAAHVYDGALVQCNYQTFNFESGGYEDFLCWSQFAVTIRNVTPL